MRFRVLYGTVVLVTASVFALTGRWPWRRIEGTPLPVAQCDAEALPFPDRSFDVVSIGFGLRNVTHKENAIAEMRRILVPRGRVPCSARSKWR